MPPAGSAAVFGAVGFFVIICVWSCAVGGVCSLCAWVFTDLSTAACVLCADTSIADMYLIPLIHFFVHVVCWGRIA
jgi:hypothetical protein